MPQKSCPEYIGAVGMPPAPPIMSKVAESRHLRLSPNTSIRILLGGGGRMRILPSPRVCSGGLGGGGFTSAAAPLFSLCLSDASLVELKQAPLINEMFVYIPCAMRKRGGIYLFCQVEDGIDVSG